MRAPQSVQPRLPKGRKESNAMTTAAGIFKQKGVWHSELVPACDPAGIVVTFEGRPMESKDKKGNWYVYFKCQGNDHYYNIENEDIRRTIEAAPVDRPVTIRALGTRDSATMSIEDAHGAFYPEPNEGASNHLGNPGRPVDGQQNAPEEQAPQAETGKRTLEDVYLWCLLTAHAAQKRFLEETGHAATDEDIRIATTLLIQTGGR